MDSNDGDIQLQQIDQDIQLKHIAAQLTGSMIENNSDEFDAEATVKAFLTIYQAVKSAA